MTRATASWMLLGLLVATNLLWLISSGEAEPPPRGPERENALARIAELERALAEAGARTEALEVVESDDSLAGSRQPSAGGDAERSARRAARQVRLERERRAYELMRQWVEHALQTADPSLRTRALEVIRTALSTGDAVEVQAALTALAQLGELDYDRAAFRPLVLPFLGAVDDGVRAASLYALYTTEPRQEDLALLLPMVGDPSPGVRSKLAHILSMYSKGVLDGKVAEAVVALLDDEVPEVRNEAMRSLWGARVTPAIEDRYLALLERPETRHDAVYFGFSTFEDKSPRVVEVLIDALDDANWEIAGRARWGLGFGVPSESHGRVADAALRLLQSRSRAQVQRDCLELLESYGSSRHAPALEVFAARPTVPERIRERAREIATGLRERPR